jgi:Domain of unknown function (DUF4124)
MITGGDMKRALILAVAVAFVPAAGAELYKYVDKDGKTVYSDTPPANVDAKQINVQSGRASTAAAPASGPKTAIERDKELQKGRDEAKEKQKKADQAQQEAADKEYRCAQARSNYAMYADGGRITKYNEKGERVYLGDAELELERERSRRDMDEACKK